MDTLTDLPPAPALSPSLSSLYSSLSTESQRLFVKVFKYLWEYVYGKRSLDIVHSYWGLEQLRLKYHLTINELSLLTYLYTVTNRGKYIVNSGLLIRSGILPMTIYSFRRVLVKFKDDGFITRASRDLSQPYLTRSISRQKIFITFTGKGVALVDKIESDLKSMVLNSSIVDVTTGNTKGWNHSQPS